jgi:hypothetical protein
MPKRIHRIVAQSPGSLLAGAAFPPSLGLPDLSDPEDLVEPEDSTDSVSESPLPLTAISPEVWVSPPR